MVRLAAALVLLIVGTSTPSVAYSVEPPGQESGLTVSWVGEYCSIWVEGKLTDPLKETLRQIYNNEKRRREIIITFRGSGELTTEDAKEFINISAVHLVTVLDTKVDRLAWDVITSSEYVTQINLVDVPVDDYAFRSLISMKAIQILYIERGGVQDSAFTHADVSSTLRELQLVDALVSDKALVAIGRMAELRTLSLSGCRVTSVGVKELAKLSKLQSLDLSATLVDDAALTTIARMENLEQLLLRKTCEVTEDAVNRLSRSRPELQIH